MRLRTGQGDRKKIIYKDNPLLLEQRYQKQIPTKSQQLDLTQDSRPKQTSTYMHKDKE